MPPQANSMRQVPRLRLPVVKRTARRAQGRVEERRLVFAGPVGASDVRRVGARNARGMLTEPRQICGRVGRMVRLPDPLLALLRRQFRVPLPPILPLRLRPT
jgi:hypothetical protein